MIESGAVTEEVREGQIGIRDGNGGRWWEGCGGGGLSGCEVREGLDHPEWGRS